MKGLLTCAALLTAWIQPGFARVQNVVGTSEVQTLQLSSVTSQDEYTTLTHPRFRAHQVRVKKTEFCDSTVK